MRDQFECDAKLDRWAASRFNLEHSWDNFVDGFLAEHDVESTESDSAPSAAAITSPNSKWWCSFTAARVA